MSHDHTSRHLEVQTGGHLLAGTDAPVWVQLVGERQRTQWMRLTPPGGTFERASLHRFTLNFGPELDPGEVTCVNVQIGEGGATGGWFLDTIRVDGELHRFDGWLALDEPPYRLDASSIRDDDARAYDVVVKTSDAFLAGTNAPVFLQLVGTHATTPWIRLHEVDHRPFQAGAMDHFRFWSEDVGVLVGAGVRHTNVGVAPGWRLDWIDIDGRRLHFDRWLALDEGDRRLDAFARHRPFLKPKHPLRVSLTTFADLRERAEAALTDDLHHANRVFSRYGVTLERAAPEFDVVLGDERWITFQARHAAMDDLAEELCRLRALRTPRSHQRVLPAYYVGGFEHMRGRYPDVSRPPRGVFLSLRQREAATLAHELGRFFGLRATSGAEVDGGPVHALRVHRNPPDVYEGDVHNIMAESTQPLDFQGFTDGQFAAMVLGLMRYVG